MKLLARGCGLSFTLAIVKHIVNQHQSFAAIHLTKPFKMCFAPSWPFNKHINAYVAFKLRKLVATLAQNIIEPAPISTRPTGML